MTRASSSASRAWTDAALIGFAVLACAAAYAPSLSTYFTSEDFPFLSSLLAEPPWRDWWQLFTSPMLGTTFVKFYRPVSLGLLAAEAAAFGTLAWPYHLTHVAVHCLNVVMVYRILGLLLEELGERRRWMPGCAALLFGLYPLHPNAVLFVASFATLFSGTFFLAAFLCYLLFRRRRRPIWWLCAGLALVLALGSYEGAVVFAALTLSHHLLLARTAAPRPPALAWQAGCVALTAAYLLLRLALFGEVLGGYASVQDQYVGRPPGETVAAWARSLAELAVPWLRWSRHPAVFWPVFALLFAVPGLVAAAARIRRRSAAAGTILFALAWIVAAMAPFSYSTIDPSTGRYWYFAAMGLCLYLPLLCLPLRGPAQAAGVLVLLAAAAGFTVLLRGTLRCYEEAGATALAITEEFRRRSGELAGSEPVFVGDYPYLVRDAQNLPAALVFLYGLHEAANPPFNAVDLPVYPLPVLRGQLPLPLLARNPGLRAYSWNVKHGRLEALDPAASLPLLEHVPRIAVAAPADGARYSLSGPPLELEFTATSPTTRLVLAGQANHAILAVPAAPGERVRRPEFPVETLQFLHRFAPGTPVYWWLEVREDRRVVAFSPARVLFVEP